MRMYDLIRKKRDGGALNEAEIAFISDGFLSGDIPDYQMSALMMAIYFRGMNDRETFALAKQTVHSGEVIDLSKIPGIKVDKHSSGGVGDKISLVLAPLVAACGIPVPKLSGRGLGHTGGTLDKLESIPGFRTDLKMSEFIQQVKSTGLAIAGQTATIVPLDKAMYALRDLTATVENQSLIAASIISKKIAGGADKILLDVKCGSGSFIKSEEEAISLARKLVTLGHDLGKETMALVTSMDEPLGYTIGNALEVRESIEILQGRGPSDVLEVSMELGKRMLIMGEKAQNMEEAGETLTAALRSGRALDKMREWILAQGGNTEVIENLSLLPLAPRSVEGKGTTDGYVTAINAEMMGQAAMVAGAGRRLKTDRIDMGAGIVLKKKIGDRLQQGEVLFEIFGSDEANNARALEIALAAVQVESAPRKKKDQIIAEIR